MYNSIIILLCNLCYSITGGPQELACPTIAIDRQDKYVISRDQEALRFSLFVPF